MVSNTLVRDRRVSPKAKGVALWLLSHSREYRFSTARIAEQLGVGQDQVKTALKELEEFGYLERVELRDGGRVVGMEYLLDDNPQVNTAGGKSPDGGPASGEPGGLKEDEVREDQREEDQGDISAIGALFDVPGVAAAKEDTATTVPDEVAFPAFWAVYPLRKAKQNALKAWERALLRVPKADRVERAAAILEGAKRYAKERADQPPQFTKHPATWLNGGCWEDEAAPVGRGGYRPYRDQDIYPDADPWFDPDRDLQD